MSDYRHVISLGRANGVDADRMVNVIHTRTPGEAGPGSVAEAEEAALAIPNFYVAIKSWWCDQIMSEAAGAHLITSYRLTKGAAGEEDDSVGVPVAENTFTTAALTTATSNMLPAETAAVITLLASEQEVSEFGPGGTRPRSRRRGRIFVPLNANDGVALAADTGDLRLTTAAQDHLLDAVEILVTQLNAVGHQLVVYSRTEAMMRPITGASVDNVLDTVRSRGASSTNRLTRVIDQAA